MKNTDFAEAVSDRRMDDFNIRANWLSNRENARLAAHQLNKNRREENKYTINSSKHRVLSTNIYSRQGALNNTNTHNSTISTFNKLDLNNK